MLTSAGWMSTSLPTTGASGELLLQAAQRFRRDKTSICKQLGWEWQYPKNAINVMPS